MADELLPTGWWPLTPQKDKETLEDDFGDTIKRESHFFFLLCLSSSLPPPTMSFTFTKCLSKSCSFEGSFSIFALDGTVSQGTDIPLSVKCTCGCYSNQHQWEVCPLLIWHLRLFSFPPDFQLIHCILWCIATEWPTPDGSLIHQETWHALETPRVSRAVNWIDLGPKKAPQQQSKPPKCIWVSWCTT